MKRGPFAMVRYQRNWSIEELSKNYIKGVEHAA